METQNSQTLFDNQSEIDSSIIRVDTCTLNNIHYTAKYKDSTFFIYNNQNDTLYSLVDTFHEFTNFEFKDFNEDGYKDVIFNHNYQTPLMNDLLLYNNDTKNFINVNGFIDFPAAERITGTPYYFSYHKSGCADMNWDSDLFYIKNYQTIKIGNIVGRECLNEKIGIYIYKISSEKKILVETISVDTLQTYTNHKWDFIEKYWLRNYSNFAN